MPSLRPAPIARCIWWTGRCADFRNSGTRHAFRKRRIRKPCRGQRGGAWLCARSAQPPACGSRCGVARGHPAECVAIGLARRTTRDGRRARSRSPCPASLPLADPCRFAKSRESVVRPRFECSTGTVASQGVRWRAFAKGACGAVVVSGWGGKRALQLRRVVDVLERRRTGTRSTTRFAPPKPGARARHRTPHADLRGPRRAGPGAQAQARRPKRAGRNLRVERRRRRQYSTGTGSRERQRYHVATLRQGCQFSATSRICAAVGRSPPK